MQLQISPNWWSCLATSFAMALDISVHDLFQELGHNGSEMIFADVEEPYTRRAFHPQEFLDPCLKRGYVLMIVEAMPVIASIREQEFHCIDFPEGNGVRIIKYMEQYKGVLAGEGSGGKPHAVAWDRKSYYDPNGTVSEEMNFNIREFFALVPLQSNP